MFQLPLRNVPNSGLQFFRHTDFADCAVYTSIYSDLDIFCEIIYLLQLTFFLSFSVVFDVYRDSRVSEQYVVYNCFFCENMKCHKDQASNSFLFLEVVLEKKKSNQPNKKIPPKQKP